MKPVILQDISLSNTYLAARGCAQATVIYVIRWLAKYTPIIVASLLKPPAFVLLFGSGFNTLSILDDPEIEKVYKDTHRLYVSCKHVFHALVLVTDVALAVKSRFSFLGSNIHDIDVYNSDKDIITESLLTFLGTVQGVMICLDGLNLSRWDERQFAEIFLSKLSQCPGLALFVTVDGLDRSLRQSQTRLSSLIVSDKSGFTISSSEDSDDELDGQYSPEQHAALPAPRLATLSEIEHALENALFRDHASTMCLYKKQSIQLLQDLRTRRAEAEAERTEQVRPTASTPRRRHRRMKGFLPGDESFEISTDDQSADEQDASIKDYCDELTMEIELVIRFEEVLLATIRGLSANLLPTVHLSAGLNVSVNVIISICDTLTCYRALREARTDDQFGAVQASLVEEWKFIATIVRAFSYHN